MNSPVDFLSKCMGWIVAVFILCALVGVESALQFFGCMAGAVITMVVWFFMANHFSKRFD